jgi:hypothetical protein
MTCATLHDCTSDGKAMQSVRFQCPGCNRMHAVWVKGEGVPVWGWNNSLEKPTFTPSILCHGPQRDAAGAFTHGSEGVCHSFVTDGRIQFLSDCTHPLANHTVDLPQASEVRP